MFLNKKAPIGAFLSLALSLNPSFPKRDFSSFIKGFRRKFG